MCLLCTWISGACITTTKVLNFLLNTGGSSHPAKDYWFAYMLDLKARTMGRRMSKYEQSNMCLQFFISGANGIAKHSGEKIICRCPSQPFLPKRLGWQKGQHTYALSFYRSQDGLGWSKFFVPDQTFIYILWQSQKFCTRQKDDLHSVKLFFVLAQKFLKRH